MKTKYYSEASHLMQTFVLFSLDFVSCDMFTANFANCICQFAGVNDTLCDLIILDWHSICIDCTYPLICLFWQPDLQ